MDGPCRSTERNIKSGGALFAKPQPGAMLHQPAESCRATTGRRERVKEERQKQRRRCSRLPSRGFYIRHAVPTRRGRVVFDFLSLIIVILTWTSLLGAATAQDAHGDRRRSASLPAAPLQELDSLTPGWKGPSLLLVDTSPPPVVPPLMHLQHRQNDKPSTTRTAATTKATLKTDPNATPSDFTVPQPFDTALSNNFTAPCAAYFRRILTDQSFQQCHPVSLLLQTSSGFFDASKSFVRITQTLEATCAANFDGCLTIMNTMARELRDDANCAVDYANDNPQVLQAFNGLVAYEPLYQATCVKDDEGSYCFANAVTNTTSTTDAYPYYLPLGVPFSAGTRPTCNSCLQDTMAIFSAFASNSSQPVSKTYNAAAQQVDLSCGPTFINMTAIPLKGAASGTTVSLTPTITLFIMLILYFF